MHDILELSSQSLMTILGLTSDYSQKEAAEVQKTLDVFWQQEMMAMN